MNLSKSFDTWLQHIFNTFILNKNNIYDGRSLNGFKIGKNTKPDYETILTVCLTNNIEVVIPDNINEIIYLLYNQIEPKDLGSDAYDYLLNIIRDKRILSINVTDEQLNRL